MTGKDLYSYAKQFQIKVTPNDAELVANFLRGKNFDIFQPEQKELIVHEIGKITSIPIAKQVEKLFTSMTK